MTDAKCQTVKACEEKHRKAEEKHRRGWIRLTTVWGSTAGLLILAITISVSASTEAARVGTAIESLHADVREIRATQVEMLRNGRRGE